MQETMPGSALMSGSVRCLDIRGDSAVQTCFTSVWNAVVEKAGESTGSHQLTGDAALKSLQKASVKMPVADRRPRRHFLRLPSIATRVRDETLGQLRIVVSAVLREIHGRGCYSSPSHFTATVRQYYDLSEYFFLSQAVQHLPRRNNRSSKLESHSP